MTNVFLLSLIITGISCVVGYLAIANRQYALLRGIILLLLVFTSVAAVVSLTLMLSRPKPVSLEWIRTDAKTADVRGSHMIEDKGIYLLLLLEGYEEPAYFVIPWNRDLAEQLQKAEEEAKENDTGVKMDLPFEKSWDLREPMFHATPPPAMPPKGNEPPPVHMYQSPQQSA